MIHIHTKPVLNTRRFTVTRNDGRATTLFPLLCTSSSSVSLSLAAAATATASSSRQRSSHARRVEGGVHNFSSSSVLVQSALERSTRFERVAIFSCRNNHYEHITNMRIVLSCCAERCTRFRVGMDVWMDGWMK